jgi:hypothetical protein
MEFGRIPFWGKQDFVRKDFGRTDFGITDFGRADFGRTDFGRTWRQLDCKMRMLCGKGELISPT